MKTINTNVLIEAKERLPIEIVQTSKSTFELILTNLPSIISIVTVIAAGWFTYKLNRKLIENQSYLATTARDAEHENRISEFRHQWLQDVRNTGSELCQRIIEMQILTTHRNMAIECRDSSDKKGDTEATKCFQEDVSKYYDRLLDTRSHFYNCSSRLKLLFKKDEPQTSKLFNCIDAVDSLFEDLETTIISKSQIDEVISSLQEVLKAEWEVTKSRSWASR
ncbi:hypothetical protein [Vibrio fluvialis]|uniref:hypothetical protein n=1 Tax=Vibrio fluvialis TaxID=676 RepID=UPI002B2613D5|nr:hypothetical protein [Vibrio fluvialis]WPK51889.1 hypothetical protein NAF16_09700 [Vibrio fluvialis]